MLSYRSIEYQHSETKILIDASALLLVIPQTDKSEMNNPDAEPDAEFVRGLLS